MLKRFLTYTLLILLVAGCSDEFHFPNSSGVGEDGSVVMTLDIPAIRNGLTRSEIDPEYVASDITILIFNGESETGKAAQHTVVYADASRNTGNTRMTQITTESGVSQVQLWFRIDKELMTDTLKLRFYFIANCPNNINLEEISESELKSLPSSVIYRSPADDEGNTSESTPTDFVMCGKASFSHLATSTTLLTRNAAKVSVALKEGEASTPLLFDVFGTATESPLLSAILINEEDYDDKGSVSLPSDFPVELPNSQPRYVHPTDNPLLIDNIQSFNQACYVVVKAQYKGSDYFYRLDFMTKNEGSDDYLALSPTANHWYKFEVTEVTGPGYPTLVEAAKHPEAAIQYAIHDHSPLSFNMASDGIRELGVTHEVIYTGLPTDDSNPSSEVINIKFFSKFDGEVPTLENVMDFISIEDDWLTLSGLTEVSDGDDLDGEIRPGDSNDTGVIFRFTLNFLSNKLIGDLSNTITVKWMGLERSIPVTWERNFNGADVTTAKLSIKYNGTTVIEDYWAFLASTDNPDGNATDDPKLWGIQEEQNNGKIRNQGFHFPVMYGSSGNYASYSYTLSFKDSAFGTRVPTNCSVTIEGDPEIKNYVTCSVNGTTMNISRQNVGSEDYTYAVGTLIVKVEFKEGTPEEYRFDLYHTGFFHQDKSGCRLDAEEGDTSVEDWRYYEVVPIDVNGETRYMLDRNLGAKSAEMYIRNIDGTTLIGNSEAAGGYYKVAMQEDREAYKDPSMFDDMPNMPNVSPPGYCVPKQNVWDAIRNSQLFHTESAGEYFNSYYDTKHPRIGKVYFPKSMFYLNYGYAGETRDGYYWSSTAATGTEKEEIGKWLKMFTISGNTTSYTNGCVLVPKKDNPGQFQDEIAYGASLRCVNKIKEDTKIKRTSFNVSGATHVYLYRELANGERISTTTWPGHAIGTYNTITTGHWFGFSFESSDFDPDDLYVIFNFIDQAGIIHTLSQSNGTTICTTSELSPNKCTGWKVTGNSYEKLKGDENRILNHTYCTPTEVTALKQWWLCDINQAKVNLFKNCSIEPNQEEIIQGIYAEYPVPAGKKRIFMTHTAPWTTVFIYTWYEVGALAYNETEWPGKAMTQALSNNKTYWYADIPIEMEYIIFNNGVSGNYKQTKNIDIRGHDTSTRIYDDINLK